MRYIILFFLIINSLFSNAQRIGAWKIHLPFNKPLCAAEVGNFLFVGTRGGLYSYHLQWGEVKKYTKADGLSDIEINALKYYPNSEKIIIGYSSANIDILSEDGSILNIPDIFRFPILGRKTINQIYINSNMAYIACSFGIIVLNIDKGIITESYQNLGINGDNVDIFSVSIYKDSIYAATSEGLKSASLSSSNLADYHQWNHYPGNKASSVVVFNEKLYIGRDTLIQTFDGQIWNNIYSTGTPTGVFEFSHDKLCLTGTDTIYELDKNGVSRTFREKFINRLVPISNGKLVLLSESNSLAFIEPNGQYAYFTPNGPASYKVSDLAFDNDKLWVVPEGPTDSWILSFNYDRFFSYDNVEWNNHTQPDPNFSGTYSFWKVVVNPQNQHVFAGSWGTGITEYFDQKIIQNFNASNSPLDSINIGGVASVLIGGMCFDANQNLWVTNPQTKKPLLCYTKSGSWYSYNLNGLVSVSDILTDIIVDDNGYKWMILPRGKGMIAFDDNNTPGFTGDDNVQAITTDKGKGYLPDLSVNCLVKDQEGNLWVGTAKGLTVFYTPGNVFNGQNFDAQQVIISQNGKAAYLFGDLSINHIAVDAGNRKWIATRNGVYLISPDGQNIIYNFNKSNSPLLSDYVSRIGIHPKTGEVFFATDRGLVSFQGDALPGIDEFGDVIIYPNPVKPEYDGLIAIKGLYNNASVKITDIAGNVVYETRANGSVATWNGKNFKGEKALTGVYLVFASNADGSNTHVGKIVFIH